MRRRDLIAGLLALAAGTPVPLRAANPGKRLALFSPTEPTQLMNEGSENRYYRALFGALRRLGFVDGETVAIERWGRENVSTDVAALADDVVRSRPDAVYVIGPGALLFKKLTSTIPIVTLTGDPIAQGLVQNLGRPGGNITGVSVDAGPAIHGKRIALLRELYPAMSRLAWLVPRPQWEGPQGLATRSFCESLGLPLTPLLLQFPSGEAGYRNAVAEARNAQADAIMIADNPDAMTNRKLIVELVRAANLAAVYPLPEFVQAGGLMAYSFDLVELNIRAASGIAAVLRGMPPGEIPFYQASKFELSINLGTAKAQGIEVPPTLLASAEVLVE